MHSNMLVLELQGSKDRDRLDISSSSRHNNNRDKTSLYPTISFSCSPRAQASGTLNLDRLAASSISNKHSTGSLQPITSFFRSLDRLQTNHTNNPVKLLAKVILHLHSKPQTKLISRQARVQSSSSLLLDRKEASYISSLHSKQVYSMVYLLQLRTSCTLLIIRRHTCSSIHSLDLPQTHSIHHLHRVATSNNITYLDRPNTRSIPNPDQLQVCSIRNLNRREASCTTTNLDRPQTSSMALTASSTPHPRDLQTTSIRNSQRQPKISSIKHLVRHAQVCSMPLVVVYQESTPLVKTTTLLGALLVMGVVLLQGMQQAPTGVVQVRIQVK